MVIVNNLTGGKVFGFGMMVSALIFSACAKYSDNAGSTTIVNKSSVNEREMTPENTVRTGNPPTTTKPPKELENVSREIFNQSFHPKTGGSPPSQTAENSGNSIAIRPAPDNSEIYPAMNSEHQPMDVRVFKNNAFLLKMERVYISDNRKEIKIYLKNGRTAVVAGDRIPDFSVASISSILKAADFKSE